MRFAARLVSGTSGRMWAISRRCLVLGLVVVLFSGCAGRLPPAVVVTKPEVRDMVATAYARWQAEQPHCQVLDAAAEVSFSSAGWLGNRNDKLDGYLQAMSPSYLKFVGVNPLGQPLLVLTTDGKHYRYVVVPLGKAYEGAVDARAIRKYVPVGFRPGHVFYWLAGRLPPEGKQIASVRRDTEREAYWLELERQKDGARDHVLFDARDNVIYRHILLGEGGEILLDVEYGEYALLPPGEAECRLPGRITVSSHQYSGRIEIILHSFASGAVFSGADFQLEPPADFERILVQ